MSIYKEWRDWIKCSYFESKRFNVKTGVRQEGVLSPLLVIIYMDKCLRDIWGERTNAKTFAYADDVAVIADAAEQLQQEMGRQNAGLELNGLKMNKDKTEVMHMERRREDLNTKAGEQPLQQTQNIT